MRPFGMKSAPTLPSDSKQLFICRHAKSSWQDHSLGDVDRPLNKRGQRDAPEMGRRLRQRGLLPDLIVASHAVRARTTASLYADQLGYLQEKFTLNRPCTQPRPRCCSTCCGRSSQHLPG